MNETVMRIIDSEVEYAREMWEGVPLAERPLRDADKPVEFWVMHMERYLRQASDACYGTDKTKALEAIRKVAALAVRCMTHNETPPRG